LKTPKIIDLSQKQMTALLSWAKRLLSNEDFEIVNSMPDTIVFLSAAVGKKNAWV
jgi:hypothetical protein